MAGSASCQEKDMQLYLKETQELQKQGKYAEALERHIWFHNNALQYDKAMSGVRNSFALSYWKSLGKVYPPARKALIEIRDRKTMEVSTKGYDLLHDVSAINRTLGEEGETIKLFEVLMKNNPGLAKRNWIYVKDVLFKTKRYDIIQQYIGSPLTEFSAIEEQHKLMALSIARLTTGQNSMKARHENSFVEKTLRLIDFALANKDKESAREIKQKALAVVQDNRLEQLVI